MKNILLFVEVCMIALTSFAQNPVVKNGAVVTVLDLGTASSVLGYSGGTRTMLWADDDLNVVVNFHRMGPGATPPGLSGYLGMDLGLNMGMTQDDWMPQIQVYASTLASAPNYYDACSFPSAAIYNPAGNISLSNAYLAWFAPNYANLAFSGFGGYSYGAANLADPSDTTKHLRWYNAHPFTHIPDGFTVSQTGVAHMVDRDINTGSGSPVYQDSVIYGRGVWNVVTKDFDYTFTTLAFPCIDGTAADCKIAVSPDGMDVWMSVLTNPGNAMPLLDSTYFPVLRKSTDGGLTWSDLIAVEIDGPYGISEVKNQNSDYFIMNFFPWPYPTRDEIPFTTAFDHSLSVDKWGNPHMGVAIGYATGHFSLFTGIDSLINVYDIYSTDGGDHFHGICMGSLKTFRGTWGGFSSDNRVYISRTKTGDKMFVTWNDTRVDGEENNQHPDVWARGFDLITHKLTKVNGLINSPKNVTEFSAISGEAYWQCASPIVFTDNNKYTIPICTQWFADPAVGSQFKYIPDFSFINADFTSVGIDQDCSELTSVKLYPNPVKDIAIVSVNLPQQAIVSAEITNLFGRQLISLDKGYMEAGIQQFSIDAGNLAAGIYFIIVVINGQKFPLKAIVE
jgi:hypothetical protein